VFGQHDMPMFRLGHAVMSYQVTGIELDLDLAAGLAHFDAAADPVNRHRVAVGVHRPGMASDG
jgi:hypothetical protein